jgi:hypothetical protein
MTETASAMSPFNTLELTITKTTHHRLSFSGFKTTVPLNVFQFTSAVGTKVEVVRKRVVTTSNGAFHQVNIHLML